jgi:hypothetical protein
MPWPWKDSFEWCSRYGQVAGCYEDSNVTQGLLFIQILLKGAQDIVEL